MLRSMRAEALKSWKRPAVWVCVVILVLVLILVGYGIEYFIYTYTKPPKPTATTPVLDYAYLKRALYPTHFHQNVMSGGAQLGGVLMMIIGVLLQGSEYGWGTVKTVFTQRPPRWLVLLSRLSVLATIAVLVAALLLAVGAALSWLLANIDGKSAGFPFPDGLTVVKALLALSLIYIFWAAFGFVLATLFRQSALAIGLGLAYALVIEALIFGLTDQFVGDPSKQVHQWFPLQNVGFLVQSFGQAARGPNSAAQAAPQPFADGTHGAIMVLSYCALFVTVSLVLSQRRDVTT